MRKGMPASTILKGLLLVLICFWFTASNGNAASYEKVSAAQAKALMEGQSPHIVLDVRTEEEFQERHIKGAILIPHTELKERAASELPDKDALILIYCRSGRRSEIAAKDLVQLGYTRVYDFGSIQDWPYGTVTGTDTVKQ